MTTTSSKPNQPSVSDDSPPSYKKKVAIMQPSVQVMPPSVYEAIHKATLEQSKVINQQIEDIINKQKSLSVDNLTASIDNLVLAQQMTAPTQIEWTIKCPAPKGQLEFPFVQEEQRRLFQGARIDVARVLGSRQLTKEELVKLRSGKSFQQLQEECDKAWQNGDAPSEPNL